MIENETKLLKINENLFQSVYYYITEKVDYIQISNIYLFFIHSLFIIFILLYFILHELPVYIMQNNESSWDKVAEIK